mmetsp:Transcript_24219/g.52458  ORF Transcript_24219/g.52458 Transcript_24219/m.52458 type:complete len:126 (-) Transcript_24219:371-748(-)
MPLCPSAHRRSSAWGSAIPSLHRGSASLYSTRIAKINDAALRLALSQCSNRTVFSIVTACHPPKRPTKMAATYSSSRKRRPSPPPPQALAHRPSPGCVNLSNSNNREQQQEQQQDQEQQQAAWEP